ncbi:MAG: acyltransferase [Pseudomonadota bacterium]
MTKHLSADFAAFRARKHFGNLDGLRFVCIMMVLWHHNAPIDTSGLPILQRGFLGVDFFFVLSGFLITTLLLREIADTGRLAMRNFYLRRILRIVPVYFFVVTCVAGYYIGLKGQKQFLEILPYYYLFLSNFLTQDIPLLTITWSLAVEEQYYLLWPLLLTLLPRGWLVPISVGFILLNVLVISGTAPYTPPSAGPLLFKLPNATYAPIILGSLVAILLHRPDGFAVGRVVAGWYLAPLAGFVVLLGLMHVLPADLRGVPNMILHLVMAYTLIALVVAERNVLTPLLTRGLVMRIGAVSYGIYLYHLLALDVVNRIADRAGDPPEWLTFLAYIALSYGIAELSFRTLEAYFQRFRPAPPKPQTASDLASATGVSKSAA